MKNDNFSQKKNSLILSRPVLSYKELIKSHVITDGLNNAKLLHEKKPESLFHPKHLKQLLRTLFIIGHFSKNFDFDEEEVKGKANASVSAVT